ncbi:hypothetical protein HK096_010048, partial [Nowakowskiella sp. JEL0078]
FSIFFLGPLALFGLKGVKDNNRIKNDLVVIMISDLTLFVIFIVWESTPVLSQLSQIRPVFIIPQIAAIIQTSIMVTIPVRFLIIVSISILENCSNKEQKPKLKHGNFFIALNEDFEEVTKEAVKSLCVENMLFYAAYKTFAEKILKSSSFQNRTPAPQLPIITQKHRQENLNSEAIGRDIIAKNTLQRSNLILDAISRPGVDSVKPKYDEYFNPAASTFKLTSDPIPEFLMPL